MCKAEQAIISQEVVDAPSGLTARMSRVVALVGRPGLRAGSGQDAFFMDGGTESPQPCVLQSALRPKARVAGKMI